jgi:hypothetical protein
MFILFVLFCLAIFGAQVSATLSNDLKSEAQVAGKNNGLRGIPVTGVSVLGGVGSGGTGKSNIVDGVGSGGTGKQIPLKGGGGVGSGGTGKSNIFDGVGSGGTGKQIPLKGGGGVGSGGTGKSNIFDGVGSGKQ